MEDAGISKAKTFDCKSFINNIELDGERYSVSLPWKSEHEIDDSAESDEKILGVLWDTKSDTMSINLSKIYDQGKSLPITKRNVLRTIASIYDPLGIISPLIIPLKVFFQKLSIIKCDWDSELSLELKKRMVFTFGINFIKINL